MPPAEDPWPPLPRRRVFLMRHADVEYFDATGRPFRPETVPLTGRGREQARATGTALAEVPFDRVITSGLRRTEETASLVLTGREVLREQEPRLREIETGRMSEWERATGAAVRDAILRSLGEDLSPESRFLAGETFASAHARVRAVWHDLLARRDWNTLLVVAHGVVNRLLLGELLGLPLPALGRLEQDACGLNLVEVDAAGVPLVRLLNFTAHDPGKQTLVLSTLEGLYDQYHRGRSGTVPPSPPSQG